MDYRNKEQNSTTAIRSEKSQSENVRKSVMSFLGNPDFAEHYNDFYDTLISRGMSAEDALLKTDSVFIALKNKDLYIEG